MKGLTEGMKSALAELSRIEGSRENAMALSRRVIRLSKNVIHCIHLGESCDAAMDEMTSVLDRMRSESTDPFTLTSGPVMDAMSEYAEAAILDRMVSGDGVPSHTDLGIPASAWILGLADCEGELRRVVMSHLMDGDLEGAKEVFSLMEEVHEAVMSVDVPDAIAAVRRKQDVARGLMDKTRSEILMASVMQTR